MRSSPPQLNIEYYRPEQYRPPVGSRHTAAAYSNRKPKNLIAPLGLTLGVVSIVGSWIPFLNFLFLAIAIFGSILSTIGFVQPYKNKLNKGESLLGLMLNGVSIVLFFSSYIIIYFASQQENLYRINGSVATTDFYGWLTGTHKENQMVEVKAAVSPKSQGTDAAEKPSGMGTGASARLIEDPFGKKVSVKGLDVVINKTEERSGLLTKLGFQSNARSGRKFLVVDATLTNTGHISNNFFRSDDFFTIQACKDPTAGCPRYYEYESSFGLVDDDATGKKLPPQLGVQARLAYEVPQDSRILWLRVVEAAPGAATKELDGGQAHRDAYF